MKLYHIAAMAENRVIGNRGKLPWHFSEDLKRFKKLTMGSAIIMGRKTFESIGSKPLPGRENFVLSRNRHSEQSARQKTRRVRHLAGRKESPRFFHSLDEALQSVKTEKAFMIGGADLFSQTIDRVDGIYLTLVKGSYEGDAYYPEIPPDFEAVERKRSSETPELEFILYRRKKSDRPPIRRRRDSTSFRARPH